MCYSLWAKYRNLFYRTAQIIDVDYKLVVWNTDIFLYDDLYDKPEKKAQEEQAGEKPTEDMPIYL